MNELTNICCGCRFSENKEICHGDCLKCDIAKEIREKISEFESVCEYCWNLMKNGMSVDEALNSENAKAAIAAARKQK